LRTFAEYAECDFAGTFAGIFHIPFITLWNLIVKEQGRAKSTTVHHSVTELNITPLLDLAFVLLVIFIITTPQMMNNLEMNLPSGKPPPPQKDKPKINRIAVNAAGQITLNDQTVTLPALKDDLQQLKSDNPDVSVVVKGDENVDDQNMIGVLDILKQLDITKVGLAPQETSSGS
jgi:biopolymer transport protein ExbD